MATYVPPKRATELIFYVGLPSQANTKIFQVNPTLAAGDVKVSKDGGATANLNTLPAVTPAGGKAVKVTVSTDEMTADNTIITFSDAAGDEWCDVMINAQAVARQIDDLTYPNTSGRGLDVNATGGASIDWGAIDNPTTSVNLSGTTVGVVSAVTLISANGIDGDSLAAGALTDIQTAVNSALTATVADSVPADGTRPSVASGIYMLTQMMMEKSLSGVTMTVKKPDGSTALMTFTLNDATSPTSITRAS